MDGIMFVFLCPLLSFTQTKERTGASIYVDLEWIYDLYVHCWHSIISCRVQMKCTNYDYFYEHTHTHEMHNNVHTQPTHSQSIAIAIPNITPLCTDDDDDCTRARCAQWSAVPQCTACTSMVVYRCQLYYVLCGSILICRSSVLWLSNGCRAALVNAFVHRTVHCASQMQRRIASHIATRLSAAGWQRDAASAAACWIYVPTEAAHSQTNSCVP